MTNFTAGAGTQTLPIWIFTSFQRPNQLPLVNVAAVLVLILLDRDPGLPRDAAERRTRRPSPAARLRS